MEPQRWVDPPPGELRQQQAEHFNKHSRYFSIMICPNKACKEMADRVRKGMPKE
jgi:hypothetical protein